MVEGGGGERVGGGEFGQGYLGYCGGGRGGGGSGGWEIERGLYLEVVLEICE